MRKTGGSRDGERQEGGDIGRDRRDGDEEK